MEGNHLFVRKILLLINVFLTVFFLVMWFLSSKYYGTVTLSDLPKDAKVYINGVEQKNTTFRYRPSSFRLFILSSQYQTPDGGQEVSIKPFSQSTVKPVLEKRDVNDFVGSVIGAFGLYGRPESTNLSWSSDGKWLTAQLGPGGASPIALHYDHGLWKVEYYQIRGFPQDIAKLPPDIASKVKVLNDIEEQ